MFYYEIIPLEKLNTEKFPSFTYSSEKKIPLFSLVKIPLRKKTVKGIAWKNVPRPFFPTKKIQTLLEKNFLKKNQLLLAEKIADYHLAPFNEILKLFFPPQVRQKNQTEKTFPQDTFAPKNKAEKILPTSDQKKALEKIIRAKKNHFLLFGPASSGKTLIAWETAEKIISQKKQILVILPEIFLAHQEIDRWKKWLKLKEEEVFFVHSALKKTDYRQGWENVKKKKTKLIIGSRSGLFLPFADLGLVVLDEEQDPSHKQWEKVPFYNVRKITTDLAEIFSAKLLFLSATPTPESFFNPKMENIFLPRLKTKKWEIQKPQIVLADLKKNFFSRNKSPLTTELKTNLTQVLNQQKMVFLFVPQRGFGRKVVCLDCRQSLVCPNCQTKLADLGENYRCLKCGHQVSSFSACPNCKSFRLKSSGLGTEKIAREIKTLFPKKNLLIADRNFFQKEAERKKTWDLLKEKKLDILVGTQAIVKGFDLPFLGLTVVLEAENILGNNNFRFDERKMGTLFQLAGRVNRPQSDQKGIFLLQTFWMQNPLWETLKKMDWQDWLEKELANRKATGYPPFCFLTKLICTGKKSSAVEKMTEKLYTDLSQPELKKNLLSLSSFPDVPRKLFSGWKKNLLLKTAQPINEIKPLKKFLRKISAQGKLTIDVDPENVF